VHGGEQQGVHLGTMARSPLCQRHEPWHYPALPFRAYLRWGLRIRSLWALHHRLHFTDPTLQGQCTTFCKTYRIFASTRYISLRGNFAAPDGDYYTQFWPDLPVTMTTIELRRMLSAGSHQEGRHRLPADRNRLHAAVDLQIVDSCPCSPIPSGAVARGATIAARFGFRVWLSTPAFDEDIGGAS